MRIIGKNGHRMLNVAVLAIRGYDSRWREARKFYLQRHPLCVKCLEEKKITPATVVDHIVPHRGDKNLFWDQSNWQSLCKKHHDKKLEMGYKIELRRTAVLTKPESFSWCCYYMPDGCKMSMGIPLSK